MWVKFFDNIDTQDCRFFDLFGKHPNVRACGKSPRGWINYLFKTSNHIEFNCSEVKKEIEPCHNYVKKKNDREAFEADEYDRNLQEITWPVVYKGIVLEKPDPKRKKRHLWIWGEPNLGKTFEIQELFKGKKAFMAPKEKMYRWEGYNGQEVVIMDDPVGWNREELIEVAETWQMKMERIGRSRNIRRYWPIGVTRLIIVLSNFPPSNADAAFNERFEILEVTRRKEELKELEPIS